MAYGGISVVNAIIIVILVAVLVFGVKSYAKKLANGCCGAGGDEVRKVRVEDKDPAHYPYSVTLSVEGMTCSKCKARVENALNGIDGVWAQVDLQAGSAQVRMKKTVPDDELYRVVAQAGYAARRAD